MPTSPTDPTGPRPPATARSGLVPSAGHFLHLERPELVDDVVAELVAG